VTKPSTNSNGNTDNNKNQQGNPSSAETTGGLLIVFYCAMVDRFSRVVIEKFKDFWLLSSHGKPEGWN
jgi:hypothetical protein